MPTVSRREAATAAFATAPWWFCSSSSVQRHGSASATGQLGAASGRAGAAAAVVGEERDGGADHEGTQRGREAAAGEDQRPSRCPKEDDP